MKMFDALLARAPRLAWRRVGLPGALGLVIMVAAAVLALVLVPRARTALAEDEKTSHRLRVAAARTVQALQPSVAQGDPGERFLGAFPDAATRHQRVDALLAAAARAGVVAPRSDIRAVTEPGELLTRVQVLLPVSGTYPALRRFADEALRADPAASLDRLRIERVDAGAREFRAEMQWSLWMRSGAVQDSRSDKR